jgi:transcriptional regulator with XRE-family HTH domain
MQVVNDASPDRAAVPTPEQFIGRQVRMLRQIREWSQHDVAEKMRAYGYQWSQATVTRLEAATRPIRLNELADLAALFGVPVTHFLEFWTPEYGMDDLDALRKEIAALEAEREVMETQLHMARTAMDSASMHLNMVAAEKARTEGRLRALKLWLPRLTQSPGEPAEGGDGQ